MIEQINDLTLQIANFCVSLLFFNIAGGIGQNVEFLVALIILSCLLFVLFSRFVSVLHFVGAVRSVFVKSYQRRRLKNTISSQKAFWTSISGAVGVGSIAGICAAVYFGGPGTVFWIMVCGFIAMPLRYAEVFFGHKLRKIDGENIAEWGPFAYFGKMVSLLGLNAVYAKIFAFLFVLASFGALAMQANPLLNVVVGEVEGAVKVFGALVLALVVLYCITGGLKRVSAIASKIGVYMSILYAFSIFIILVYNYKAVHNAFALIIHDAFSPKAIYGGILTTMFLAFKRAIIASEVGFGTTSILHGRSDRVSSKDEARLGMIAPFFGNLVFCSLSGLMLVVSGAVTEGGGDIETMRFAFVNFHPMMNIVLIAIILMFGISTIITWFFYASSALKRVTQRKIMVKILPFVYSFLVFATSLTNFVTLLAVIDFFTVLIVIPNVVSLIYLLFYFKKHNIPVF